MSLNVQQVISPLIQNQFPEFYKTDGPQFIQFVQAYYEFLEQGGSESRKILSYRDVDTTVNDFIKEFRDEYLVALPYNTATDTAYLVKHIQDLYKSKGSTESYKLLFQLLYQLPVSIYNPGSDIMKPSDGIWIVPQYLECSKNENSFGFIGQEIVGSTSGATAVVDNVARKLINNVLIDVFYIDDITGQFMTGEAITCNGNFTGAPVINGSLNAITLPVGGSGANNNIGDIFYVSGNGAYGGVAVVTGLTAGSGKVNFSLASGGYGFSNSSVTMMSNTSLGISNITGNFTAKMPIAQPLTYCAYTGLQGHFFTTGDNVSGYNGTTLVANGYIVANNIGSTIVISTTAGSWLAANSLVNSSNSLYSNAIISASADITVNAYCVGANGLQMGTTGNTSIFYSGAQVVGYTQSSIGIVTTTTSSKVVTGSNTDFQALVNPGDTLYIRATGALVGTVNNIVSNTSLILYANAALALTSNTGVNRSTIVARANTGQLYNTGSSSASFTPVQATNLFFPTETIQVYNTPLSSNNNNNINFLDMLISGNNTGNLSNAYGFAANTSGTINSPLNALWTTANLVIGSVGAITNVNIGQLYNAAPFVYIDQPLIDNYDKFNETFLVAGNPGSLASNTFIYQDILTYQEAFTYTTLTGSFIAGEGIIQNTTNAYGIVVSSNSTYLLANVVSGSFNGTNFIIGQQSNANATPTSAVNSPITKQARGLVLSVNNNIMSIERASFNWDFLLGPIYSLSASGSKVNQGTVYAINNVYTPGFEMGINTVVPTTVVTASGIATSVRVINSGFGYTPGLQLYLNSANASPVEIFGTANVYTNGTGNGYWYDNRGKLDSNKYIHDNNYYQEYSYEIQSKLPLAVYGDVLKKVIHIAGTKMFGKVIIDSEIIAPTTTTGALITVNYANGSSSTFT